jgi:hypothetical protein
VDIKSETQLAEEEAGYGGEEWAEGEWVQNESGELVWQPAEGGEAVSAEAWSLGGSTAGSPESPEAASDGSPSEGPAETEAEATGADAASEPAPAVQAVESAPAGGATTAGEEDKGGDVATDKAADEEEAPA